MGIGNGLRIGFYRAGMLAAGLVLIASTYIGWRYVYILAAGLVIADGLACLAAPRERARKAVDRQSLGQELASLSRHPKALALVLALLLGAVWLANDALHWSRTIPHLFSYVTVAAALVWATSLGRRDPQAPPASDGPLFGALL